MKKILSAVLLLCVASLSSAEESYASELYEIYCKHCHGVQGTGAPLAFNEQAWAPYLQKGVMRLVQSTINGSGKMPAMGTCMECEPEDLVELIQWMSQPKP